MSDTEECGYLVAETELVEERASIIHDDVAFCHHVSDLRFCGEGDALQIQFGDQVVEQRLQYWPTTLFCQL